MKYFLYILSIFLPGPANLLAQAVETAPASSLKIMQVLDSVQLAYTDAGKSEETILFIHGLGGSRKHWQQTIPALSSEYRTLAVDLPGYGDSRLREVPQDSLLHFFANSLWSLMDSLSIPKAHVVGHSMGGQIAMLLALEHPERVQKLVLVAPAGIETFTEREAQGLRTFAANTYPQKHSEVQIRQNYALNFYQMPEAAEGLIQDRIALNDSFYFPIYANVLIKAVEGMLATPLASRFPELEPPTLLLFGEEDQLIPNRYLHPGLTREALARQGQQAIPKSQLIMLSEVGHLLMIEQPEAFNQALKIFLNKTDPN
jgi:pimeloyl-ACP methyl ester carboxylesterase